MITSLLFVAFFILIYFHGRGVFLLFNRKIKSSFNLYSLPVNLFFPLFSLFFIANLTLIFNFFIPIKIPIFQALLLIPFFFNVRMLKISKFTFNNFIKYCVLPGILSLSTLGIGLAYDAGLYQLNSQLWIRESNIPIGLYNIHFRYGYSSIIEYISANFWIGNNFILLHFVNLSFLSTFIIFIYYFITENNEKLYKHFGYFIIIFGFLDNFGYSGGRNGFLDIEAVSKQDTPFAILFILSNLFLIHLIRKRSATSIEIITISLLVLFSIQMRLFGIIILLLFIYTIFMINIGYQKIIKLLLPSLFLGGVFILKNILITGCMFFPIELTCFDTLSWHTEGTASAETKNLRSFHKSYKFGTNPLLWFSDWMTKPINRTTFINFSFSFLLIFVYKKIIYKQKQKPETNLFLYIYLLSLIILWLVSAPGIRLGLGIFSLAFVYLSMNNEHSEVRYNIFENKILVVAGLIFVTLLMPRLENYKILLNNPFTTVNLNPEYPEYIKNEYFGVTTKDNSLCWVKIDCIRYGDEVIKRKIEESKGEFFTFYRTTN